MSALLKREHFSVSRATEYFTVSELEAQTGMPASEFGHAILSEFIANALDAPEMAGRAPVVDVTCLTTPTEILLSVADNGDGIPDSVVTRLLDFTTRTSNKEAYRSPTRGAQGNALKTALGIPIALGASSTQILIEGAGSRHAIKLSVNLAGQIDVAHDRRDRPGSGTRVTIAFPRRCEWNPRAWVEGSALFNPHARISLATFVRNSELGAFWIDHAEFPDRLFAQAEQTEHLSFEASGNPKKYSASDATPAHWYTAREFERVAYLTAATDDATTVRAFVRNFKGASRKVAEIAGKFPPLLRDADAIELHRALLEWTDLPRPETLGRVGREHFRSALGGERFWYAHKFGCVAGRIPFLVECAVAETDGPRRRVFGMNFSTTLDQDPVRSSAPSGWSSVSHFLDVRLRAAPLAVAFHLVMPRLPSLNRSKSRVHLPNEIVEATIAVVMDAAKVLTKEADENLRRELAEQKRVERQEAAERRRAKRQHAADERDELHRGKAAERLARAGKLTKREAVFAVLPEAYSIATDGERVYVTARDLYYAIRPLYERIEVKDSNGSRELDFSYFSQTLLPDYQRTQSELPLIDYKARGVLYLPHSGAEHPIGDRELRSLQLPEWEFDKVLFVEKTGVWETLKQTGGKELCRRFDMAVIAGEGYASVAIRKLLALLSERGVTIYVWHDADASGYDIARTLSEETQRLPGHSLEIIDIGLSVADAVASGLQVEHYLRRKSLPEALEERLSEEERRLFIGEKIDGGWRAGRIEINAIPVKDRVAWLENRLPEARPVGAYPDAPIRFKAKVVPADEELPELVDAVQHERLVEKLAEETHRQIRVPAIVARALEFLEVTPASAEDIRAALKANPEMSWVEAAALKLPDAEAVTSAVALAIQQIIGGEDDAHE